MCQEKNVSKKYEILYDGAFPIVRYKLEMKERLKAESDAMIAMSPTIDVEGSMAGGLLSGVSRMLAGESFFFQNLTARRGPGEVLFGHAIPGGIIDVEMDGSYEMKVQKNGFLAGTEGIEIDTKMQSLGRGLFSGEGFFILSVKGRGVVFLSSYGAIHPLNLGAGEQMIIDNGHLVAWTGDMHYAVEKASNGWVSSFTSGENLVCRFTGPGVVLIQTRNPGGFVGWCRSLGLGRK
jgi:uncharacterized protein (TIGR00266 family)